MTRRWKLTITIFMMLILLMGVQINAETTPIDQTDGTPENQAAISQNSVERLRWPPPELVNPEVIQIPAVPSRGVIELDPNRDYIIEMPDQPIRRNMVIVGGRNVVMIGGEIFIPWQSNPTISSRTALKIKDSTGIVHIEGLLLHGDDISEGIQINAPQATIQLQNIGIFNVHARDQVNFTDNHPDVIQTYGNVADLRIDRMTGTSDYQGLFFKADFDGPHGIVHVSRTNIIGDPTARKLIWFQEEFGAGPFILENVWIDVPESADFGNAVWPTVRGSYPARAILGMTDQNVPYATWPVEMSPIVTGHVYEGTPPGGNFVNPEDVGIGYTSPGYMD